MNLPLPTSTAATRRSSSAHRADSSRRPSSNAHPFADLPPFAAALLENLESLVIAVIMALLLKFFVVEAYKIPTGSMQPTLMGDPIAHINDRILVTKFLPNIRLPHRWEVWVFRYPHDITKNYIKRVIGLPGETLEILDGDIWIDGALERKPPSVQRAYWRRVSVLDFPGDPFAGEWTHTGQGSLRSTSEGLLLEADSSGVAAARRTRPVRDSYLHGYPPEYGVQKRVQFDGRNLVGDVRLEIEGTLRSSQGSVFIVLQDGAREHRFTIGGPESVHAATIASNGVVLAQADRVRLPTAGRFRLAAEHWDDTLRLLLDGRPVLEATYPGTPETHRNRSGATFGIEDGSLLVRHLALARDVYYVPYERDLRKFRIPEGQFFMLGDNTLNSKDSRAWKVERFELADGRYLVADVRVPGEEDPNPRAERIDGRPGHRIVDRFGEIYHVRDDAMVVGSGNRRLEYAHFVPSSLLLGRAFMVFWPVFHPFRVHVLR